MNTRIENNFPYAGATMKASIPITTPFAKPPDPFADAEAVLRNALWHRKRFEQEADAKKWLRLSIGKTDSNGNQTCTLTLNHQALTDLKPVIFDVAVNFVHALDLTLAACIRLKSGTLRKADGSRQLSPCFPVGKNDAGFNEQLKTIRDKPWIEGKYADAIQSVRAGNSHAIKSLVALKEIANSCKHWELAPAKQQVLSIAVTPLNQQQIFFHDHDNLLQSTGHFQFPWPHSVATNIPVLVVHKLEIETEINGVTESFSDRSIFNHAQQYVRATIGAMRQA